MIRSDRCVLLAALVLAGNSWGADVPLYQSDAPLAVTLTAPHKSVYRARRNSERPEFDGTWEYTDADGTPVQLTVKVRARGNFRRENCRYVPLQVNFKKSEVKGTLFKGQNKVKLVSPCKTSGRAEQWLLLEYLSYRAYQHVTPLHFRTRLLKMTFAEPDGGKSRDSYAFLIESDEDTADRLGMTLELENVPMSRLDAAHSGLVELFQFFIGNNDYSNSRAAPGRKCCHNTRLLVDDDPATGLLPVPYDFDHAGMVNASYAVASENVPNPSVRKRYFTGLCKPDEAVWTTAFARFNEARTNIEQVYNSALLSDYSRKSALKYVGEFYEIINDPRRSRRSVIEHCRG
ncbi:MAG: hypothetical protein AAGA23_04090 [Pseudomonadota bacterium]